MERRAHEIRRLAVNGPRVRPLPRAVRRSLALAAVGLLLLMAGPAEAQRRWWGGGGWRPTPLREGLPMVGNAADRGFTFCRLLYQSVRREPGGYGWNTDYPISDVNFLTRFSQLTTVHIARWSDGEPGFAVVRATDDELYQCPFLFASDVGTMGLSEIEAVRLRDYLLKGGFLWADDFWGERAWRQWESQIRHVLPGHPIVDVPLDHDLLSALYHVADIPQVPSIQHWRRAYTTSERGAESAEPHLRAIFSESGRLLVLMSHNTDIADGWEREGEDEEFFYTFSPASYALGIDILIWAMTH